MLAGRAGVCLINIQCMWFDSTQADKVKATMKATKERRIFETFPRMYRLHKRINSQMERGFTCGDGWYDIIWRMSERIEPIVCEFEAARECVEPHPMTVPAIRDVREYDGYLRVRVIPHELATSEILAAIIDAESESVMVCEACGQPGKPLTIGRKTLTLCQRHMNNEK